MISTMTLLSQKVVAIIFQQNAVLKFLFFCQNKTLVFSLYPVVNVLSSVTVYILVDEHEHLGVVRLILSSWFFGNC